MDYVIRQTQPDINTAVPTNTPMTKMHAHVIIKTTIIAKSTAAVFVGQLFLMIYGCQLIVIVSILNPTTHFELNVNATIPGLRQLVRKECGSETKTLLPTFVQLLTSACSPSLLLQSIQNPKSLTEK